MRRSDPGDAISSRPACIDEYRRRLNQLGCPLRQARRRVQELAEHFEDLKSAAMEEGLSESAAEARAAELLGEPRALADHLVRAIRRSSWAGRHPVLTFCVLPLVAFVAIWLLADAACFAPVWLWLSDGEWDALTGDKGAGIELIRQLGRVGYCVAVAATALLFCSMTQRAACGRKWAIITSAVCSFNAYVFFFKFDPHALFIGFTFSSRIQDLTGPVICLLVCFVVLWRVEILSLWKRTERMLVG